MNCVFVDAVDFEAPGDEDALPAAVCVLEAPQPVAPKAAIAMARPSAALGRSAISWMFSQRGSSPVVPLTTKDFPPTRFLQREFLPSAVLPKRGLSPSGALPTHAVAHTAHAGALQLIPMPSQLMLAP